MSNRSVSLQGKNVLAFFDHNLPGDYKEQLQQFVDQGAYLLPLNTPALAQAASLTDKIVFLDDILSDKQITDSFRNAVSFEREWFVNAKEQFSCAGVCWPEFDREAMHWFWRNATHSLELAKSLKAKKISRLYYYRNDQIRPSLYYYPTDTCALIWQYSLKALAESITYSQPLFFMHDRARFPVFNAPECNYSQLAGKVVFALNAGEFSRFAPAVQSVKKSLATAGVILDQDLEQAQRLTRDHDLAVLSPANKQILYTQEPNQFSRAFVNILGKDKNKPWYDILRANSSHFEYYCRLRWPALVYTLVSWVSLWEKCRPKAVVISALADTESILPAEAARRLGIPVFAMPHGSFYSRLPASLPVTYGLYTYLTQKLFFKEKQYQQIQLVGAKDILAENEYNPSAYKTGGRKNKLNILVITNPISQKAVFYKDVQMHKQIQALTDMLNPAANVKQLHIKIKQHPSIDDRGLLSYVHAHKDLEWELVDHRVSLKQIAQDADLVVAVNYVGSALIHLLRLAKPLVHYITDKNIFSEIGPQIAMRPFEKAALNANSSCELWKLVSGFSNDPKIRARIIGANQQFLRDWLSCDDYPAIGEVIADFCLALEVKEIPRQECLPELEMIRPAKVKYKHVYGDMPSHELDILCSLVCYRQPHKVFEFGTYEGATTLQIAANCKADIYTMDLPPVQGKKLLKNKMTDAELDVFPAKVGLRFKNTIYAKKIKQILADSQQYDFRKFSSQIDFIFVDASHHYQHVLNDSKNALAMCKPGGIVLWHDYAGYAPGVVKVLNALNQQLSLVHISGTSLVMYRKPK